MYKLSGALRGSRIKMRDFSAEQKISKYKTIFKFRLKPKSRLRAVELNLRYHSLLFCTLRIYLNFKYYGNKKKNPEELRENKLINQAKREVPGFTELLDRFERTVSVLGRSQSTFRNYSFHVAAISLHFGKIPRELDPEQVHDYLFFLQKKSKSPSQSYFKHTAYGLRFLLKSEGFPYEFLRLPSIKHEKKLQVEL